MSSGKTWGIIGLGWLGKTLSETLKTLGMEVWSTRRSEFKFESDPFPDYFCHNLFLNTPPLLSIKPIDFVKKIPTFCYNSAPNLNPKNTLNDLNVQKNKMKIIFISSTSVYGDHQGICNEETLPEPLTDNGKWLLEVELELKKKFSQQLLIIRPGGLISEDRHPVRYLSQMNTLIPGGENLVNLIHRTDLVNIILETDKNNIQGTINAVSPYHPKKTDYYNEWTKKLNLNPIGFTKERTSLKVVESLILPSFYKSWAHKSLI